MRSWMKRIAFALLGIVVLCGAALSVMAARYEPVFRPNLKIGSVDVGGLTPAQASLKLRQWWERERVRTIALDHPGLKARPPRMSLTSLGLGIDDQASVARVPVEEFWDRVQRNVGLQEAPEKSYEVVYTFDPSRLAALGKFVRENSGKPEPARVKFDFKTQAITRIPEKSTLTLETSRMRALVFEALEQGSNEIELPLTETRKSIPDEDLSKIATVQSLFSTRFPTSKVTRCANIKLAASKIDGTILKPGEEFSFNGVVGRRTTAAGFKVAGVYKNGKHDTDVGGGICQVSTTLYNAAVRSDLTIKKRSNHSLPITYVPLGQDATVDYDSHDLVFVNTHDYPIAIFSLYEPGKLTFAILGQKLPYTIKLESVRMKSWANGTQYVHDGSLPPGKQRVIEKGGGGSSYVTYKITMQDGAVISKKKLNESYYRGGPRIVAINKSPQSTSPATPAAPASAPANKPATAGTPQPGTPPTSSG